MEDKHTLLWPTLAFAAFCLIGLGARQAIGTVYGAAEARDLLEALSRAGLELTNGGRAQVPKAKTVAFLITDGARRQRTDEQPEATLVVIKKH